MNATTGGANTSRDGQLSPNMLQDSIYDAPSINDHDLTMETSMMQHRTAHSRLPNFMVSTQAIKPSVSFRCLGRDEAKTDHFIDLHDGPSPLQKRDNVTTLRDLGEDSAFMYERERAVHTSRASEGVTALRKAQKTLYTSVDDNKGGKLASPRQMREELAQLKSQLTSYTDFKET